MATKTLVSVEDYLTMSFDGAEPEFVDGEIVERHLPSTPHYKAQGRMLDLFRQHRERCSLYAYPEVSLRIKSTRIRIADIAVFSGEGPAGEGTADIPPAVAIEVLSRDDRFTEVQKKFADYKEFGIPHIWLVDPWTRKLFSYAGGLHEVPALELPEYGVTLTPGDVFDQRQVS